MFLTILLSLRIIFRDIVSIILGTLSKDFILIFLEKVRNYFAKNISVPCSNRARIGEFDFSLTSCVV